MPKDATSMRQRNWIASSLPTPKSRARPGTSWWLDKNRDDFNRARVVEQDRMATSRYGQMVSRLPSSEAS